MKEAMKKAITAEELYQKAEQSADMLMKEIVDINDAFSAEMPESDISGPTSEDLEEVREKLITNRMKLIAKNHVIVPG